MTETRATQRKAIQAALESQGFEVIYGKGGFWLRGHGHITFATARRMAAVPVPSELQRQPVMELSAWGDWAIVAALNGIKP